MVFLGKVSIQHQEAKLEILIKTNICITCCIFGITEVPLNKLTAEYNIKSRGDTEINLKF